MASPRPFEATFLGNTRTWDEALSALRLRNGSEMSGTEVRLRTEAEGLSEAAYPTKQAKTLKFYRREGPKKVIKSTVTLAR